MAAVACAAAFAATTLGANAPKAPVNTTPPTIQGSLYVGKTLTASNGSWSNSPTGYLYKWIRCNNPAATRCQAIAGATQKTYTLTQADVGHAIAVFVSATNTAGTSSPASSKVTDLVTPAAAPSFKGRPTVTGKAQVGEALVAKAPDTTGGSPEKVGFQWQACDQNGANCTDIAGATGESYGVRAADADKTIRVKVTATNEFGTATQTSDRTAVVQKVTQQVTVVTTSLTASRAVTICCQVVRLTGTISPADAGQSVVIMGKEFDALTAVPVANATTDASGNWTALVRPHIQTTYRAQAGTTPSAGITVNVRPRVGFGISGRLYTTRVTARDSFAGSTVLLQRRTGSHWRTLQRVVLNLDSYARFSVALPHGRSTLRVVLPAGTVGGGYLGGVSKTVTVHR